MRSEYIKFKTGDRLRHKTTEECGTLIGYSDLGFQHFNIKILMDNGNIVEETSLSNYWKIFTCPTK